MDKEFRGKLRVAILTQPLHVNYGGILQAYALARTLSLLGYDATVVNRDDPLGSFRWRVRILVLQVIKKILFLGFPFFKLKPDNRNIERNTKAFIKKNIPTSKTIHSTEKLKEFCDGRFDAFVVGSDQVWRPEYSPELPNYFFDFIVDKSFLKKISYAASFGTDIWEYDASQTQICKKLIEQFDAVSVRESSAIQICKRKFGVHAELVLDPTLLLSKSDYLSLVDDNIRNQGDLFVYILDPNSVAMELQKKVESIYGFTPYSVCTKNHRNKEFCKMVDYIVPPVEDWICAFRDASFILTDSFHGCVFSILFEKPFFTIGNTDRGTARFSSLLSIFGLENRLLKGVGDLTDEKIVEPINWERIKSILDRNRQESLGFLEVNLETAHFSKR